MNIPSFFAIYLQCKNKHIKTIKSKYLLLP
jgi:hypothetical protein